MGQHEATADFDLPDGMRRRVDANGNASYLWDTGRGLVLGMGFVPPEAMDFGVLTESEWHPFPRGMYMQTMPTTWGEYAAFCAATGRPAPPYPEWVGPKPGDPIATSGWTAYPPGIRWEDPAARPVRVEEEAAYLSWLGADCDFSGKPVRLPRGAPRPRAIFGFEVFPRGAEGS